MTNAMTYIYEVYRERSFSQAARKLFVSQPALSAIIKKTEEEIGTQLFDRSSLPIRLTEAGELYIEAIHKIMAIEEELSGQIDELFSMQRGHLNIAGANFFSSYILPPILQRFYLAYPGIDIVLTESDSNTLYQDAAENNIHLILDAGTCDDKIYDSEFLMSEKILFAVPVSNPLNEQFREIALTHEDILNNLHLKEHPAVDLSAFSSENMILLRKGHDMHWRSEQICKRAGFYPHVSMSLNQLSTAANICAAGLGCSFLTDTLIKHGPLKAGSLIFYTLDDDMARRNMFFAYHKNMKKSRLMECFIQIARETYADDPV